VCYEGKPKEIPVPQPTSASCSLCPRQCSGQRLPDAVLAASSRGCWPLTGPRRGDAAAVDQQVVLRAELAAVGRVRAGRAALRLARTLKLSRLARDQSSWRWRPSWSSSRWWSCCHTPARCQSRSRRQQVTGLPQPQHLRRSRPRGDPFDLDADDGAAHDRPRPTGAMAGVALLGMQPTPGGHGHAAVLVVAGVQGGGGGSA
jgi:hypothetical protein